MNFTMTPGFDDEVTLLIDDVGSICERLHSVLVDNMNNGRAHFTSGTRRGTS
jgi:hypothetical protein